MRKIFGFLFMVLGLVLIGFGSYDSFEKIGKELSRENTNNYYNGLYLASGDSIFVSQESEEVIEVVLNNETYEFIYNGQYYEDQYSGFYIMFDNDELKLYKDGEIIRTLHKDKK